MQCIPPKERATAVSLTTSGMYMGSAAAIQWLPGVATRHGAAAITRLNGCLGLAWLLLWMWASRLLPATRCALLTVSSFGSDPSRSGRSRWQALLQRAATERTDDCALHVAHGQLSKSRVRSMTSGTI